MRIIFSAESTIDIDKELLKKWSVPIIHFHLERDGRTFRDDEYKVEELFEYTDRTGKMCHTSAPNIQEYKDYFDSLIKKGDAIIHFSMSSKLSSAYSNAVLASEDNPNIRIIDTHTTSGAIATLLLYAQEMDKNGYSLDDIEKEVLKRRDYLSTTFIINEMKYLHKGGRCSSLKYFAGKMLKLRPVISTNKEGGFKVLKTYRGDPVKCIYKHIKEKIEAVKDRLDLKRAFINISTTDKEVIQTVEEIVKSYGFEEIYFGVSSPTNAYHAGPGVLGVHFLFDGPHKLIKKGA